MRKGKRFGYWKVIDGDEYIDNRYIRYIKCRDIINNKIKYVRKAYLLSGKTKGSRESVKKRIKLGLLKLNNVGNQGWSTRVKNKELPLYIHPWNDPKCKKKFRIVKKVKGKAKTIGYYKTVSEAKKSLKLEAK